MDLLLKAVDYALQLLEKREKRFRDRFEKIYAPLFRDLETINQDYIDMFAKAQDLFPLPIESNMPDYQSQIARACEMLRTMRLKFSSIREKTASFAMGLERSTELGDFEIAFISAVLRYMPSGELYVPPAGAVTDKTKVTVLIEDLYKSLEAPSFNAQARKKRSPLAAGHKHVGSFAGLLNCVELPPSANAALIVGRDENDSLKLAKFYRLDPDNDGHWPRRAEISNVLNANYRSTGFTLPVNSVTSFCELPHRAGHYGFCYVMPYCELGALDEHIRFGFDSPGEKTATLVGIITAIHAVHELKIVHGDVKPSNLMYWGGENNRSPGGMDRDELRLVLCDFGASIDLTHGLHEPELRFATTLYSAPEVLAGVPPALGNDIWSWGTIAFEIFLGKLPAPILDESMAQQLEVELETSGCPPWLRTLILSSRHDDCSARPTAAAIIEVIRQHWDFAFPEHPPQTPSRPTFVNGFVSVGIPGALPGSITHVTGLTDVIHTTHMLYSSGDTSALRIAVSTLKKRLITEGGDVCLLHQFMYDGPKANYEVPAEPRRIYLPVPDDQVRRAILQYLLCLTWLAIFEAYSPAIVELSDLSIKLSARTYWSCDEECALALARALVLVSTPHAASSVLDTCRPSSPLNAYRLDMIRSDIMLALGDVHESIDARARALSAGFACDAVQTGEILEFVSLTAASGTGMHILDLAFSRAGQCAEFQISKNTDTMMLAVAIMERGEQGMMLVENRREALRSASFFTSHSTISRYWLGSHCLSMIGERRLAARIAKVALADPRSRHRTNGVYRAALERLSLETSDVHENDPKSGTELLAMARRIMHSEGSSAALPYYCRVLSMIEALPITERVRFTFEITHLLDAARRHSQELEAYRLFFSTTPPAAWTGIEQKVSQLAANEFATMKLLGMWQPIIERFKELDWALRQYAGDETAPAHARMAWYACHAFDALGRSDGVLEMCDIALDLCDRFPSDEARNLAKEILLFKGATLSELNDEAAELLVYSSYLDRFSHLASDAEAIDELVIVRHFRFLLLSKAGRDAEALHDMEMALAVPRTGRAADALMALDSLEKLRRSLKDRFPEPSP